VECYSARNWETCQGVTGGGGGIVDAWGMELNFAYVCHSKFYIDFKFMTSQLHADDDYASTPPKKAYAASCTPKSRINLSTFAISAI
jgi:hypothetical protein